MKKYLFYGFNGFLLVVFAILIGLVAEMTMNRFKARINEEPAISMSADVAQEKPPVVIGDWYEVKWDGEPGWRIDLDKTVITETSFVAHVVFTGEE